MYHWKEERLATPDLTDFEDICLVDVSQDLAPFLIGTRGTQDYPIFRAVLPGMRCIFYEGARLSPEGSPFYVGSMEGDSNTPLVVQRGDRRTQLPSSEGKFPKKALFMGEKELVLIDSDDVDDEGSCLILEGSIIDSAYYLSALSLRDNLPCYAKEDVDRSWTLIWGEEELVLGTGAPLIEHISYIDYLEAHRDGKDGTVDWTYCLAFDESTTHLLIRAYPKNSFSMAFAGGVGIGLCEITGTGNVYTFLEARPSSEGSWDWYLVRKEYGCRKEDRRILIGHFDFWGVKRLTLAGDHFALLIKERMDDSFKNFTYYASVSGARSTNYSYILPDSFTLDQATGILSFFARRGREILRVTATP